MGLDVVRDRPAPIDAIMKANGMTQGTVGERLRAMYDDPKFRYANTDDGKAKLIADLNAKVQAMRAKLPAYFGTLPKADCRSSACRNTPRPARRAVITTMAHSMARGPAPTISTCAIRPKCRAGRCPRSPITKAFPAITCRSPFSAGSDLPLIRKVGGFDAYAEGWALYTEQLADEMGMYETIRGARSASFTIPCSAAYALSSIAACMRRSGAANRR